MKYLIISLSTLIASSQLAYAGGGGEIFHRFDFELASGVNAHSKQSTQWELEGWIGSDYNKLWVKSEGEKLVGQTENADIWALYSRNVSTFWDAQIGVRQEIEPSALSHFVLGVDGLAPYFIETSAHLLMSEDGDVSAKIEIEKEFLLTQRLHLEPALELNMYLQDVPEKEIGAGLSKAEASLKLRYEVTRHVVPYIGINYGRKFGETSSIAKRDGEDVNETNATIGINFMF